MLLPAQTRCQATACPDCARILPACPPPPPHVMRTLQEGGALESKKRPQLAALGGGHSLCLPSGTGITGAKKGKRL